MRKPEQGNSKAKAVERSWSIPAPLSSAMAKSTQKPSSESIKLGVEQREQESISQGSQKEQFFAMLPFEQPGALEGQFGFVETDGHFDLPSTSVSMHDVPGVLRAVDGLGGE